MAYYTTPQPEVFAKFRLTSRVKAINTPIDIEGMIVDATYQFGAWTYQVRKDNGDIAGVSEGQLVLVG